MRLKTLLGRALKYCLTLAVIVYAADWCIFEIRQAGGTGMGRVTVEQYLKTQLKGSKQEYDYLGTADASCSRSLFPQYAASAWNPPCWWLGRHKTQWQTASIAPACNRFLTASR